MRILQKTELKIDCIPPIHRAQGCKEKMKDNEIEEIQRSKIWIVDRKKLF
jgi:hypothetical protein